MTTRKHSFLLALLFTFSLSAKARHSHGTSSRPAVGLAAGRACPIYHGHPNLTEVIECDVSLYLGAGAYPEGSDVAILQMCYDHGIGCDHVLLLDACALLQPISVALPPLYIYTPYLVCDLFPAHAVQMEFLRVLKDEYDIHDGDEEEDDQPTAMVPSSPTNNDCSSATMLPIPTIGLQGTTIGATVSTNILGLGFHSRGPAVWYTFMGTGDTLSMTFDCSDWNASVKVVSMNSCVDYAGGYTGAGIQCVEGIGFPLIDAEAGQLYAVIVEGYNCQGSCEGMEDFTNSGDFMLFLQPV